MNHEVLHAAFQPSNRKEEWMLQRFEEISDRQQWISNLFAGGAFVAGLIGGLIICS